MPTVPIILLSTFISSLIANPSYVELPLIQNNLGLPIIRLWGEQQLLVDTGSEEVWLADDSCSNCKKTSSLCPQIKESVKQIKYFRGSVKGDYTYVNTSFGSHKVICVKESQNLSNIEANGILGIRGESTGKVLINNFLSTLDISSKTLSLYYGIKESKLFFGQIPSKYKKQACKTYKYREWGIAASQIVLNEGETIEANCLIYFDTGSNVIILQESIYQKMSNFILKWMQVNNCYESSQRMKFYCYGRGIDLNHTILLHLGDKDIEKMVYQLNLKNMVVIKDNSYKFLLEKTDNNLCILGIPSFKGYIIQFTMAGSLNIYQSAYHQLALLEISNFKTILCQYIVLVAVVCLLAAKVQKVIDETISRKIVI